LIECVICGTSNPEQISRTVVKKILARSPALVSMISQSMVDGPDGIITHPDFDRVHRVFIKLAVGHVKFELGEIVDAFDATVICKPFVLMTEEERFEFENPQVPLLAGWPEIGSRAFIETECLFRKDEMPTYSFESSEESQYWWEVQENRYRYWVDSDGTSEVRMVLSEYLAVTVYLL
jgi:hypothetical protein